MEKKKRNGLIVGVILLLGAGAATFFYLRKKKQDENKQNGPPQSGAGNTTTTNPPSSGLQQLSVTQPQDVMAFQKFANSNGWNPKLKIDGIFGPKTTAAWNSLSGKYNASIAPKPKMVNANDVLSANIKGLDLKPIYASHATTVYNMASQPSFKVNQGDLLGVVSYALPSSSGGFIVYFMKGNVKYWLGSDFVQTKA